MNEGAGRPVRDDPRNPVGQIDIAERLRLFGFSAADTDRYTPEAAGAIRPVWIAVAASTARFSAVPGLDAATLLAGELDADTRTAFTARITAEPGRSIAAAAAVTLYTVGTIKDVPGVRTFLSVDGGMSDNPRPVLYGSGYETFLPRAADAERTRAVRVARWSLSLVERPVSRLS